jgi:hypothetical protein
MIRSNGLFLPNENSVGESILLSSIQQSVALALHNPKDYLLNYTLHYFERISTLYIRGLESLSLILMICSA